MIALNCKLVSTNEIAPNIYDFVIESNAIALAATPGQFLHIRCGGETFLRRPISICDVSGNNIRFIFEVRGEGTKELSRCKIGDTLDVLAPLGIGFKPSITKGGEILLVGGGIGTFPLLWLSKQFRGKAISLLGYRNKNTVTLQDDFINSCQNVFVATDDGSLGYHGVITDIAEELIRSNKVGGIFACGPKPMLKIVAEAANSKGIPCEVSMEQRMGCGVGACMTCTCSVKGENVRVCKMGPVFNAKDVIFDD